MLITNRLAKENIINLSSKVATRQDNWASLRYQNDQHVSRRLYYRTRWRYGAASEIFLDYTGFGSRLLDRFARSVSRQARRPRSSHVQFFSVGATRLRA